jgi:hypothetical protein
MADLEAEKMVLASALERAEHDRREAVEGLGKYVTGLLRAQTLLDEAHEWQVQARKQQAAAAQEIASLRAQLEDERTLRLSLEKQLDRAQQMESGTGRYSRAGSADVLPSFEKRLSSQSMSSSVCSSPIYCVHPSQHSC